MSALRSRISRLDRGRALDRVDHAGEFDQQAVAGQLDHPAPMFGDPRLDDLCPAPIERGQRADLVGSPSGGCSRPRRRPGSRKVGVPSSRISPQLPAVISTLPGESAIQCKPFAEAQILVSTSHLHNSCCSAIKSDAFRGILSYSLQRPGLTARPLFCLGDRHRWLYSAEKAPTLNPSPRAIVTLAAGGNRARE